MNRIGNHFLKIFLLTLYLGFSQITSFGFEPDSLKSIWTDTELEDSVRFEALNAYYPSHSYTDPDSVLRFADYHIKLAKSIKDGKQEAIALNEKVIAYMVRGEFNKALDPVNSAIALRSKLGDTSGVARLTTNLGNIHRANNNYLEAFRCYYSSLAIYEHYQDTIPKAKALSNLGLLFYDIKKYDIAADYWEQSIEVYKAMGTEDEVGYIWLNLGALSLANSEYQLALQKCEKALACFKENDLQFFIADCHFLQAQIHQRLGNIDSSLHYNQKSLAMSKAVGNADQIALCEAMWADLTLNRDVNKATKMAEDLLDQYATTTNIELRKDIYDILHRCYKKQGKYNKALAMHELSVSYEDSINLEDAQLALVREQVVTDFDQKLASTKREAAEAEQELKQSQLKKVVGLGATSALLIGLLFFWYRKRLQAKDAEKEDLLLEIKRLKGEQKTSLEIADTSFKLKREKLEASIGKKINETDWKVLNILLDDPVISNKDIAEKAFLTVDGIGSSLRRMYVSFDVKDSRYMKISLLMNAMRMSNAS